jgi:hypothetical protein
MIGEPRGTRRERRAISDRHLNDDCSVGGILFTSEANG